MHSATRVAVEPVARTESCLLQLWLHQRGVSRALGHARRSLPPAPGACGKGPEGWEGREGEEAEEKADVLREPEPGGSQPLLCPLPSALHSHSGRACCPQSARAPGQGRPSLFCDILPGDDQSRKVALRAGSLKWAQPCFLGETRVREQDAVGTKGH